MGTAGEPPQGNPLEHALGLWRAGDRLAGRWLAAERQHAYAVAIEAAVAYLGRYHHPTALVAAYFDDQHDAWLERLCHLPDGRVLNYGIVEDAAYWRRFQQLIDAAIGPA